RVLPLASTTYQSRWTVSDLALKVFMTAPKNVFREGKTANYSGKPTPWQDAKPAAPPDRADCWRRSRGAVRMGVGRAAHYTQYPGGITPGRPARDGYHAPVTASRTRPDDQDPHSALARLADQCVLCGLCLPHCPTYALDQQESESPRGRISLIHALAEQRINAASI